MISIRNVEQTIPKYPGKTGNWGWGIIVDRQLQATKPFSLGTLSLSKLYTLIFSILALLLSIVLKTKKLSVKK